jgi:RimJ/RimL family protein N-acetyltransferase
MRIATYKEPDSPLLSSRLSVEVIQVDSTTYRFQASEKAGGVFVGAADLVVSQKAYGRAGSISYEIRADKRGNGYATELLRTIIASAYADLGLVNIYGIAEETNLAAQYVLQRTGFVFNDKVGKDTLRFEAWNPRFQTANA